MLWAVEIEVSNPNAVTMSVSDLSLNVNRLGWYGIHPKLYPLSNQEVIKFRGDLGYALPTRDVLGRKLFCAPGQQHSGMLVFKEPKGNPMVSATLTLDITDSMGRVQSFQRSFK